MASGVRGAIRRAAGRALPTPTRAGRLFAAEVLGLSVYVLLGGGTAALAMLTGLSGARADDLQINQRLLDTRIDQLAKHLLAPMA